MKSSSSTSSILRLSEKDGVVSSPRTSFRRSNSNSSSVTVLHQKQLPAYGAERFYVLSELQLNSVPPTFLSENHAVDDSMTAETVDLHSLEGSNGHEVSSLSSLPLQPYSILYLVWKREESSFNETEAIASFCNESILPAVHKIQGITPIRRPSLGQSSFSSSSLSRCGSDEDWNDDASDNPNVEPVRQPFLGGVDPTSPTSTRLYLVVEQVVAAGPTTFDGIDPGEFFAQLERCATKLARCVSTHTELRGLVQGVSVGIANQELAAPGLEACMDALHVGARDRRRYGTSTADGACKSLIGLIAESYADLVGPASDHAHHHAQHPAPGGNDADNKPPILQQCLVSAEWSAAGDLMTFAHRAHAVWRDQHQLPPLPSRSHKKKPVRRKRSFEQDLDPQQRRADTLYHLVVVSVLLLYFFFHYRDDVIHLARYTT